MSTSLRIRALQRLQANPQGMRSYDLLASLGETDTVHRKRLAALLHALKRRKFITMAHGQPNVQGGAVYTITLAGIERLAKLLGADEPDSDDDEEEVLPTGAMLGETRTVVRSIARTGQVVGVLQASVFTSGASA